MESRVEGLINSLHSITEKAVAVGFGVSGPEQVWCLDDALLPSRMLHNQLPNKCIGHALLLPYR